VRYALLGLAIAGLVASGIFLFVARDNDAPSPEPSILVAEDLKATFDGGSKAEWIAMQPQIWWRQIAMICNTGEAASRGYARQLGPTFPAEVLSRLRSDCG